MIFIKQRNIKIDKIFNKTTTTNSENCVPSAYEPLHDDDDGDTYIYVSKLIKLTHLFKPTGQAWVREKKREKEWKMERSKMKIEWKFFCFLVFILFWFEIKKRKNTPTERKKITSSSLHFLKSSTKFNTFDDILRKKFSGR